MTGQTVNAVAKNRAATSKDQKQAARALREIVGAYDALKNAERELKDARATALSEAKAALSELADAIHASKNCDPADLPHKTGVIVTCWDAYTETKKTNAAAVKAATQVVDDAKLALEKSIKDSRQGRLDFGDGDGAEA